MTEEQEKQLQKAREKFGREVVRGLNASEPVKMGTALKTVKAVYETQELETPIVVWCESLWQLAVVPVMLELMVELGPLECEKLLDGKFTMPLWKRMWNVLRQQISAEDLDLLRSRRKYNLPAFVKNGFGWMSALEQFEDGQPFEVMDEWPALGRQQLSPRVNRTDIVELDWRETDYWLEFNALALNQHPSVSRRQIVTHISNLVALLMDNFELLDEFVPRFDDNLLGSQFSKQLGPKINKGFSEHPLPGLLSTVLPVVETTRCAETFNRLVSMGFARVRVMPNTSELVHGFQNSQDPATCEVPANAEILNLFQQVYAFSLFDNVAFLCERPLSCHVDDRGRLHSDNSEAVSFADGFKLYAWHGVFVPQEIIHRPDFITVFGIDMEPNAELRRVMIEIFGRERYLFQSGAVLVDSDENGSLYRKELSNDEPLVMVQVTNSTAEPDGTFKKYFLRVPPEIETVKQAVAWTFSMNSNEYEPVIQT